MFRERGLRVGVSFWGLLALAITISPWLVVISILVAAALHECGHLVMLRLFHVPIEGLKLSALGAELYARRAENLSYGRELLVTLAGPAANALCAVVFAMLSRFLIWPDGFVFAGANAILCIYNLLPIPPLDGGRTVYLVSAYFFGPMVGDALAAIVGTVCASALLLLGAYFSLITKSGMFFLLAAVSLFLGILPRLRLAKGAVRV